MDEPASKDDEIKQFCQNKAMAKARQVAAFLEGVALNEKLTDIKMVRHTDRKTGKVTYEEVKSPIPMNVRVTAAKTWKEMFFDKAIGDVKEKAKESRKTGIDMKSALESLTKSKLESRKEDEVDL